MNNEKKEKTIAVRQEGEKQALLEQLKKTPIIQIACERSGVSRPTYYRWRRDDADFAKDVDLALAEGYLLVNDMAESHLIAAIKDRDLPTIRYWLQHHHPKYATRVEVVARTTIEEKLNPEQEALLRRALKFSLSGGGKIRRTRRTVEMKIRRNGGAAA